MISTMGGDISYQSCLSRDLAVLNFLSPHAFGGTGWKSFWLPRLKFDTAAGIYSGYRS